MVWFYCDDCGDTIKKPKLANHFRSCHSQTFTCVDCSRSFDRHSAGAHSTCVSEHEKYALGATKPGGYAAQGFFHEGQAQQVAAAAAGDSEAVGLEFLSERPPWRCSCCNVNCTSRETLMGHAAGAKHKRRARAAAREAGGGQEQQQQQNGSAAEPAAAADADKAEQQQKREQQEQQQEEPAAKKSKKDQKDKKDRKDKAAAEQQQQQQKGKSADDDQQQEQKSKKKSKKSKAAAEPVEQPDTPDINTAGQEQQQQQQECVSSALKVAVKKLKKKGKLGQKKLAKLLQDQEAAGQELLDALKKQLLAVEGVKLDGSKTFTYATQ